MKGEYHLSDKQKKRFYWLKLKEDFFEEDTIEWLEEQPNGKEYCLFYLKLCLKSLKTEGFLARNVGNMMIPYDPESLAKLTNSKADTVMVAMDLFKKIGLIQILDSGEIFLNQLGELVGSETEYAKQKRLQRSKNDKLLNSRKTLQISQANVDNKRIDDDFHNKVDNVQTVSKKCRLEKELEIEKELKLEIQLQQDESGGIGVIESFATFQQLYTFPNIVQQEDLKDLIDKYSDELVNASLKVAGTNDVLKGRVINFISAVLSEWNDANVKTLDQAREYTKKRQRAAKGNKTAKPIRQEVEPSWSTEPKKEYGEETEVELSPEIEARFQKYLERKEQANAEQDDITG